MKSRFQRDAEDVIDEGIANFERTLRMKNGKGVDLCSDLILPVCDELEDTVERYGVSRRGRRYRQVKERLNSKAEETMILMALYL